MDEATHELKSGPVCSICIANYNGESMLRDCIDSVLAQDAAISVEIIVHDDASSDGSVALLRATYPQVRVLQSDTNVGFCVSNNRMVAQARGEFVLLLNNDAALLPDALTSLLDAAHTSTTPTIFTLPQYDWSSDELVDRGCLLDPFYNPVPNLDTKSSEVAMAIGACLFLPRALWNELGGFPEWMESIAEDLYLCCLARLRGARVPAIAASGYRHRRGATFSGERNNAAKLVSTFRRRRLSERNKTAALFICTPTPLMWPLLVLHLFLLLMEGVAISLWRLDPRILSEIYLAAPTTVAKNLACLRTLRKEKQATRQVSTKEYFAQFSRVPRKIVLLARFGMPRIAR